MTTTTTILLGVDGTHGGRLAFQRILAADRRFVGGEFDDFDQFLGAACENIQCVLDQELNDRGVVGNSESQSPETASYIASYLLAGLDAFVDWFSTRSTISDARPARVNRSTPVRFQLR